MGICRILLDYLWDIVVCLWDSVGYIAILLTICETYLGVTGYLMDVAGR